MGVGSRHVGEHKVDMDWVDGQVSKKLNQCSRRRWPTDIWLNLFCRKVLTVTRGILDPLHMHGIVTLAMETGPSFTKMRWCKAGDRIIIDKGLTKNPSCKFFRVDPASALVKRWQYQPVGLKGL